ncbi:hypothetical protein WJM97_21910 [Okeanomitos corallinicola TIOX110]|uniref:Uncharacterized protein n=1 Tax=Okeanomitos corallinicola TIOX110 TaxID=3133117 RepID=A0ABZ2UUC7_9CYAN
METNPCSYDESLAILYACSVLELHIQIIPDDKTSRILGKGILQRILEMSHYDRIEFMKEVTQYL